MKAIIGWCCTIVVFVFVLMLFIDNKYNHKMQGHVSLACSQASKEASIEATNVKRKFINFIDKKK
jgi:hypothetical protein